MVVLDDSQHSYSSSTRSGCKQDERGGRGGGEGGGEKEEEEWRGVTATAAVCTVAVW